MEPRTLDCTGLACPLPIVKTGQAFKGLAPGETLRLITTDPGSANDVQAWAKRTGNRLLATEEAGGRFSFLLEKTS